MKSDRVMIFESMRIATKYLDPDTRLRIYDALLDYAFYGEEPEFEEGTVEHSLFAAFRPIVKNSTDNVENGKKGGRPTAKKDGKNPPLNPRIENAESGDKNPPLNQEKRREEKRREEGEGEKMDIPRERSRFQKPSLEDVEAYCAERSNGIEASRFLDFYEANGWMVGKSRMKDWRAAVRNWERREHDRGEPRAGGAQLVKNPAGGFDLR